MEKITDCTMRRRSKWLLAVIAFVLQLARAVAVQTVSLSKLINYGASSAIGVSKLSDCVGICTVNGLVSAVSYSEVLKQCTKSTCGNLQVKPDAAWDTYICSKYIPIQDMNINNTNKQ